MIINKALTITVKVFNVPENYKSFARNSYLHDEDLLGFGVHSDENKSIKLAVKDLQGLMEQGKKEN